MHTLSGDVTITVTLTQAQIAALDGGTPDIYYYDTRTSPATLVDMHTFFDSSTGALTFTANHFSTYLIAARETAESCAPGVFYTAHVQDIGRLASVSDNAVGGHNRQGPAFGSARSQGRKSIITAKAHQIFAEVSSAKNKRTGTSAL